MRLGISFMPLVLPYFLVRRFFRLMFGNVKNYRIFHQAHLDSTCDYLAKLGVPALVRPWLDVRTRFAFEKPIVEAVTRLRGKNFIDIGANMGYYTALLAKNFETILAFEPDPENLKMIRCMIAAGRLHNVVVSNRAVSDFDGISKFYMGSKRVEHSLESGGRQDSGLLVETVKLDSLINGNVDLVKVDVEGAERKVINGAEGSIRARRIQRWVIEIDDPEARPKFEEHMRRREYITRWLDDRHLLAALS